MRRTSRPMVARHRRAPERGLASLGQPIGDGRGVAAQPREGSDGFGDLCKPRVEVGFLLEQRLVLAERLVKRRAIGGL